MNASVNRNVTVLLPDVLLSYAYLAVPFGSKQEDGTVKLTYTTHGVFKPESAAHKALREGIMKVAAMGWGAQAEAVIVQLKGQDKLCIHEGNITKGGQE